MDRPRTLMMTSCEALEARRLWAVDLGVDFTGLTQGSGVQRLVPQRTGARLTLSLQLTNNGSGVVAARPTPATVRFVLRPVLGGKDVAVGSTSGRAFVGMAAGAIKDVDVPIRLRSGLKPGDYRMVALFSGKSIKDVNTANDVSTRNPLLTVARDVAPLLTGTVGGLGTRVTLAVTTTGTLNSPTTRQQSGTFTTDAGVSGTFNALLQGPTASAPGGLSLSWTDNGQPRSVTLFLTFRKDFPATLDGRTIALSATPNLTNKGESLDTGFAARLNEALVYFNLV